MVEMPTFIDYAPADNCNNEWSYGCVCVKCGKCGRKFENGILISDKKTYTTHLESDKK